MLRQWLLFKKIQLNPVNVGLVYLDIQYPDRKPREQTVLWDFVEEKLLVKMDLTLDKKNGESVI